MLKRHEDFISMLTVVSSVINANQPAWNTNSVFTGYVTDFKASRMLIDAYDKLLSRPRQLTVNRKVHSEDMPELIQASRKLLNKLDSLVNLFDGTEFEAAYHNARRIVNSGSRKAPATEETPSTN